MSATIIFDNRNYVSRLEQAGFTGAVIQGLKAAGK